MPPPFDSAFMQRALIEVLLLSVPAGLLGAWVVLRRRAFFTHGVGTAAFPGLVVAGPLGVPPALAALGAAALYALGLDRLVRGGRLAADAGTGLLLVGALALGVVLASDVFASGSGVDRLLFGSLVGLSDTDLALTAAVVAVVAVCDRVLRRHWLVEGFDPAAAGSLGLRSAWAERALLLCIALAVVVALNAVGALLVSALFVVPAATARLLTDDLRALRALATTLAAGQGVAALWLAWTLDVGPGPVLAVVAGVVFAAVACTRPLMSRLGRATA